MRGSAYLSQIDWSNEVKELKKEVEELKAEIVKLKENLTLAGRDF